MKRLISVLLLLSMCSCLAACTGRDDAYSERTFFVMDTAFTLRIYDADANADAHFSAVLELLGAIDTALSRTKGESDIARINQDRAAGDLSPHTIEVLTVAREAMERTQGAYLPTMGAVSDLWKQAENTGELPDSAQLSLALESARKGFSLENGVCTLLGEGALLDLGGIGKGYAADCVLAYLREAGVGGALLSFGSSVATLGEKGDGSPFRISLRHPRNTTATVGALTDPSGVLSVSGDYERYVTVGNVQYHHILDPESGYPAHAGLASVAVLCESGAWSDALSTAFFVMGREKAERFLAANSFDVQAVFITPDGETSVTSDLSFSAE